MGGEAGLRNAPERYNTSLYPNIDDLLERETGEELLSGPDEEEDDPFNPLITCVVDYGYDSFCDPDD